MRAPRKAKNERSQEKRERDFIDLRGMARHAVAEIHSPRKRGGDSSRVIVGAGEKTPDAANRNSHAEWESKQIASAAGNAQILLRGLHSEQRADQRADNGFSAHEERRIPKVPKGGRGIFEPVKQFAADRRPPPCRPHYPPPVRIRDGLSLAAPPLQIDAERNGVRERLEEPMWMNTQRTEVEVNREGHGVVTACADKIPLCPTHVHRGRMAGRKVTPLLRAEESGDAACRRVRLAFAAFVAGFERAGVPVVVLRVGVAEPAPTFFA